VSSGVSALQASLDLVELRCSTGYHYRHREQALVSVPHPRSRRLSKLLITLRQRDAGMMSVLVFVKRKKDAGRRSGMNFGTDPEDKWFDGGC